jgi:hypothetical protein
MKRYLDIVAVARIACRAQSRILSATDAAAEMDAGFDAGEIGGPQWSIQMCNAEERIILCLAAHYGYASSELDEEAQLKNKLTNGEYAKMRGKADVFMADRLGKN